MCVGYLFANEYKSDRYESIKKKSSWLWIVLLSVIGTYAAYKNGKVSFGGNNYKSLILLLVALMCLIFATVFMCMKIRNLRILQFAGVASMSILAIHKIIIWTINKYWIISDDHYISVGIEILLVCLIVFPLSYIVQRWFPFYIGKKSEKVSNKIGVIFYTILTLMLCIKYF